MADLQDPRRERYFSGDVQRVHARYCAVVGLRLVDRSLARSDCQRDHAGVGRQHFGDALAFWTQGICSELAPAL